jgi:hypothetical protein
VGDKFWEGIGEKLADRWAAVSVPALIFWLGGLFSWILGHGGINALDRRSAWIGRHSAVVQATIILTALLLVAATGVVVARLTGPALVFMEGYWPQPLEPLRDWLTERVSRKAALANERFQELAGPVHDGNATEGQRASGRLLTQYLMRGLSGTTPVFTRSPSVDQPAVSGTTEPPPP